MIPTNLLESYSNLIKVYQDTLKVFNLSMNYLHINWLNNHFKLFLSIIKVLFFSVKTYF